MIRKARAAWKGGLKTGSGSLTTESRILDQAPYDFRTRFEGGKGTNPEELIGAAHAGCFSMALAAQLSLAGLTPDAIETEAAITFEKAGDGFEITASHLTVRARVPGADDARFQGIANKAKAGCPVSKALKARITMDASLQG
jgi:lipoyl-dependent peroxiredoxin